MVDHSVYFVRSAIGVGTMSGSPDVSVVVGVFNGGRQLEPSLECLLNQRDVNLELIIVNDGSTDGSAEVLERFTERDARLRVIHQSNRGLTRSLITGCAEARGTYIARHDVGDISLPGRLAAQLDALRSEPDAVLCVCGAREVLEGNIALAEIVPPANAIDLTRQMREKLTGVPAHGCTMFRTDAYRRVGGYRSQFYFAQDLDLWLRLMMEGKVVGVPAVHYELDIGVGGISTSRTRAQRCFSELAIQLHRVRQQQGSEADLLHEAEQLAQSQRSRHAGASSAKDICAARYRLARRLAAIDPDRARELVRQSLRAWPLYLRSWWLLFRLRAWR